MSAAILLRAVDPIGVFGEGIHRIFFLDKVRFASTHLWKRVPGIRN
jgi:hypothetical protein